METALENVDGLFHTLKQQARRSQKLYDNARQLQSLSGVSLWSKK